MKPYGPEFKPRTKRPKAPRPKYQWPANKITTDDMAILYHLRRRTGTPINKLLQEAIRKFGEALASQPASEPPARAVNTTAATK